MIFFIGAMQNTKCAVNRKHQKIADFGDQGAAAAAIEQIKNNIKGIGNQLFIEGALHAVAVAVFFPGGIAFRQFFYGEGKSIAIRGAAQDIIAGDPVEIGSTHQKIKTAFPNPVFVVGKKGL